MTNEKYFTAEDVRDTFLAIVDEVGEDFIYPRSVCVYAEDGCPSCAVGRIFSILDADLFESVREAEENDTFDESTGVLFISEFWKINIPFTAGASNLLMEIQVRQDTGHSYGKIKEFLLEDFETFQEGGTLSYVK